MLRTILKSKISGLRVTEAELFYEGSIAIDKEILKKADILAGEKVEVLNLNNGSRSETYVIYGEKEQVSLNGPLARSGFVGDELIILAYYLADDREIEEIKPKIIRVDEKNRIK